MEIPNADLIAKRESPLKMESNRDRLAASPEQNASVPAVEPERPSVTVQLSQESMRLANEPSTLEDSNDSTDKLNQPHNNAQKENATTNTSVLDNNSVLKNLE